MICSRCGSECLEEKTPDGPHYAKWVCVDCGCFNGWIPKPDGDSTKYRREAKHRRLVRTHSRGFCEMCLTEVSNLPGKQTLEGHHVIPYRDGGSDHRENVWIVCTSCHRLIEWTRRYGVQGSRTDA